MREGAHAQLIVQNLHLNKLNMALKGKENQASKKTDRSKLFPDGKGCHLTDEAFIRSLEIAQAARTEKAAAVAHRKATWQDRKVERESLAKEWEEIKATHTVAVEKWEAECKHLIATGTLRRALPKKPIRARKPQPVAPGSLVDGTVDVEDSESEGEGGSEDDRL